MTRTRRPWQNEKDTKTRRQVAHSTQPAPGPPTRRRQSRSRAPAQGAYSATDGLDVPPEDLMTEQEKDAATAASARLGPVRALTGPGRDHRGSTASGPARPTRRRTAAAAERHRLLAGHQGRRRREPSAQAPDASSRPGRTRHPKLGDRDNGLRGHRKSDDREQRTAQPRGAAAIAPRQGAADDQKLPSRSRRDADAANANEAKPRYTAAGARRLARRLNSATSRIMPKPCRPIANSHSAPTSRSTTSRSTRRPRPKPWCRREILGDLGKDYGIYAGASRAVRHHRAPPALPDGEADERHAAQRPDAPAGPRRPRRPVDRPSAEARSSSSGCASSRRPRRPSGSCCTNLTAPPRARAPATAAWRWPSPSSKKP